MDRELLKMQKDLALCEKVKKAAEEGKDINDITIDDTEFLYEEEEEQEIEYESMWDKPIDFWKKEAQRQADFTASFY